MRQGESEGRKERTAGGEGSGEKKDGRQEEEGREGNMWKD